MCTFAHDLGELEMANKESNEFFGKINALKAGLSAGQLLVVAEQCLDSAIFLSGRSNKKQREVMNDIADSISELRETRSKEWKARDNQGPAEIEIATTSTSADAGKVS
tara:strand:- start:53 stop:376 length:324 start_codon:yes stop_codon:yes gene_type:complete